ncbi:hypothetical protein [Nocardia sp. NBC_00403]|uniref:hypothetical protein n=1 Tax=Nocardia sp. NBC_00403 TaxID=2975990 RepID=UPI002E24897E
MSSTIGELVCATNSPEVGIMIINRTHSIGACRLLANIALAGAAAAIPTLAVAIPAIAAPMLTPGVAQTNYPQCHSDDLWCNRESQWGLIKEKDSDSKDEECGHGWDQGWSKGENQGGKQGENYGWNYGGSPMSPNGWSHR